jgi:hypothetical protein
MSDLTATLRELEEHWGRLGLPVARLLRPGADRDTISERVGALSLTPSSELLDWWSWHDGATSECYRLSIGPGLYTETLETCLSEHDRLEAFSWEPQLRQWFPIASELGGGLVIVRCSDEDALRSPVTFVNKFGEIPPADAWQPSIHAMVQLWLERLRSGLWIADESGYAIESREDVDSLPENLRRSGLV